MILSYDKFRMGSNIHRQHLPNNWRIRDKRHNHTPPRTALHTTILHPLKKGAQGGPCLGLQCALMYRAALWQVGRSWVKGPKELAASDNWH